MPESANDQSFQDSFNITERASLYANDELESHPHEAFSEFAGSLVPKDASAEIRIGLLQKAAHVYNQQASPHREIELFYHFTDDKGATEISQGTSLGKKENKQIFLTKVTPQEASPLLSAKEALEHMEYWKEGKIPKSFRETAHKFTLQLKAMWRYRIIRHLDKNMVTVGGQKLSNVVVLATNKEGQENRIKVDKNGEYYIGKPVGKENDPNFSLFGPYLVPDK